MKTNTKCARALTNRFNNFDGYDYVLFCGPLVDKSTEQCKARNISVVVIEIIVVICLLVAPYTVNQ